MAGSMTLMFFTYAFVNMGMVTGMLPVVGVPLPFMSFGGTALMTLFIAVGIPMSVQTHRKLVNSLTRHRVLIGLVTGAFGAALLGLGGCASKSPPRATTGASKPSTPSGTRPVPTTRTTARQQTCPQTSTGFPMPNRGGALHRFANRPYNVFGVDYTPLTALTPLRQRALRRGTAASFTGRRPPSARSTTCLR